MRSGKWYWHIHHEILAERADEPITNRRGYIRNHKPGNEIPLRLALLKPVKNQAMLRELEKKYLDKGMHISFYRAVAKLHKEECPNCPWKFNKGFSGGKIFRYLEPIVSNFARPVDKNGKRNRKAPEWMIH